MDYGRRITARHVPAVVVVLVAGLVSAPAAGAVPPFRALESADRIAVIDEDGPADDRLTVTERLSSSRSTTNVLLDDSTGALDKFKAMAWSPGAASLAVTERFIPSPAQADDRIRIYEYPNGPITSLDGEFEPLRSHTNVFREIGPPRWSGTGTPESVRLLAQVSQAGLVSIKPDGTDARIAPPPSGPAIIAKPTGFEGFDDLFVDGPGAQPDKQITFTDFNSEHAAVVSPDGKQVAYLQGQGGDKDPQHSRQADVDHPSQLGIVDVDGTDQKLISTDPTISHRPPAWRPDGTRIGFMGLIETPAAFAQSNHDQTVFSIKPDGTDLVRHTVVRDFTNPNPWVGGGNAVTLAWGRACTIIRGCSAVVSLVEEARGDFEIQSRPILVNTASIGFLVERYVSRRKLRRVGRVPFGVKRRGRQRVRWSMKLSGRPLRRGRYRITLRALGAGRVPLDISKRVDLIVPREGKPKLRRARVTR